MPILCLIFLLVAAHAQAAIHYVDKDNSCTGDDGSDAEPWCSIQAALSAVSAGDEVRIRDAASAYDESATLTTTGTSGNVITITKDTGHNPTLTNTTTNTDTAAIILQNVSHVTVTGLTFANGTSQYALKAYNQSGASTMTNINFTSNTCSAWGGNGTNVDSPTCFVMRPIFTTSFQNYKISGSISNNTCTDVRKECIRVVKVDGVTISGNTITGMKFAEISSTSYAEAIGIKIAQDSTNLTISGNTISNHQLFADKGFTPAASNSVSGGIYCDTGGINSTIEKNTIHTIEPGLGDTGGFEVAAIFIESRCDGWTIRNNKIYAIGEAGIRIGSGGGSVPASGHPDNSQILHNTVYDVDANALRVFTGANHTIKNNIFHCSTSCRSPVEIDAIAVDAAGHDIDYNLQIKQGSTTVARWDTDTNLTSATWESNCSCSSNSVYTDPAFEDAGTADFDLTASSPARDSGITLAGVTADFLSVSRPQGAAYDMGALEYTPPQGGGGATITTIGSKVKLEGAVTIQ